MTEQETRALIIVKNHMYLTAGAGVIPIPLFDIAAVTALQVRMLKELADHYDLPFSAERGKSVIASLVGSVLSTTLAYGTVGSAVKAVPFVGWAAGLATMPAMAATSTFALGKVFIQHFEAGGTFLNFDPDQVRGHFEQEFARRPAQPVDAVAGTPPATGAGAAPTQTH